MKKTILTLFTLIVFNFAFAQETKAIKDKDAVQFSARTVILTPDESMILLKDEVRIKLDDKLDIEADSASFDKEQRVVTTYGTKKVTFNGTVSARTRNTTICRYRIGDSILYLD